MLASARADWAQRESDESVWRDRWNRMHSADLAPRVDLDAVVDVPADEYLNRTYFIDVADATHVYWFDSATPASWNYRPFYRDGDHTYVLERSGTTIRRVWFDHARAKAYDLNKDSSWSIHERANMRTAARAEWTKLQREESAWRSEWEKRERAKPATTAKTGKPADQDVDVGNVSDVLADAYPNRRYFYDADDTAHVYWYDTTAPDAWSYRPVYRTGDRAYFLERDGNAVRRYYFDDAVARRFDWSRESRWDVAQRARMRDTARQAWTVLERDERGWRGRWDAKNRR
jgi:hypothetical protein